MKISKSKRFASLNVTLAHCSHASETKNLPVLTYLMGNEYGPLMEAIEEDFTQLNAQFAAISAQVAPFQRA